MNEWIDDQFLGCYYLGLQGDSLVNFTSDGNYYTFAGDYSMLLLLFFRSSIDSTEPSEYLLSLDFFILPWLLLSVISYPSVLMSVSPIISFSSWDLLYCTLVAFLSSFGWSGFWRNECPKGSIKISVNLRPPALIYSRSLSNFCIRS